MPLGLVYRQFLRSDNQRESKKMKEGLQLTKDILGNTDRDLKRHVVQPPAVVIRTARNEQVIWQTRDTPAHKPGVRDGRR